jgi:hypothetical protein
MEVKSPCSALCQRGTALTPALSRGEREKLQCGLQRSQPVWSSLFSALRIFEIRHIRHSTFGFEMSLGDYNSQFSPQAGIV